MLRKQDATFPSDLHANGGRYVVMLLAIAIYYARMLGASFWLAILLPVLASACLTCTVRRRHC